MEPKQRVAILGGGVGAMTAAFELSKPGNIEKYDITIYQMGWRLGGQGASGRNQAVYNRIEEHGLHAWGGFYENGFRVMRECYDELGRKPGEPLARLWDIANPDATDVAFKPHDNVVFCEYIKGQWEMWKFPFEREPGLPGDPGNQMLTLAQMLARIIEGLLSQIGVALPGRMADDVSRWSGDLFTKLVIPAEPPAASGSKASGILGGLEHLAADASSWLKSKAMTDFLAFLEKVAEEIAKLCGELLEMSTTIRRDLIVLDFMRTVVVGGIKDNILELGFDPLEKVDFRAWLVSHGAMEMTADSVLVRGFYDYMFSFLYGDPGLPTISAGTALWHALRLTITYRGAVFWLMQAGMGDTVFAPFYLVLKKRGVKFQFFHRVDNIVASADTKAITSVVLTRQVKLSGGADTEYNPLFPVKGLPCWPSEPLWDQISGGEKLRQLYAIGDVDFEAPATMEVPWPDAEEITLQAGRDFDLVISNISVAALAVVANGLIPANPGIISIYNFIQTVQTMAVQIWFTQSFEDLGWTGGQPVLTGYQRPNSTWGAMTHLLVREEWERLPENLRPHSLAYFCGPYLDSVPMAYKDAALRRAYESRIRAVARQWFQDNAWQLFPKATRPADPTALSYAVLSVPPGITHGPVVPGAQDDNGLARFEAQYMRGNVNPAERYVIPVPGDSVYRPREGESGIQNLYFVGDWIYTELGGCVESAVMSGLMVARRLTGEPQTIIGELPQTRLGYKPPGAASA